MIDAVTCPHCRERLDIPAEYRGRPVRCGNCQTVFDPTADDVPVVTRSSSRPAIPRGRPLPDDEDDRRPSQRSNVGVVLLLAVTLFAVGGCCGLFNVLAFVSTNPEFVTHTSPEGKFKVDFPAGDLTSSSTTNPLDEKLEGVLVTAGRDYGQERYMVKSYPLHAEGAKLSPADALKLIADAEVKAIGVGSETKRDTREDLTHNGFPLVDVMTGSGNGITGRQAMLRVILAGKRVYVVSVQGQQVHPQQGQPQPWWQRQFFLSFDITDPPPKPAKKDGGKE